jgi:hypothetical protein
MPRWFKRTAPEPAPLPETTVEALKVAAKAPLFNATDDDHFAALAYRADAIARGTEQRAERGEVHPEHPQMVAEAMEHGWRLVRHGKWAMVHIQALQERLGL